MERNRPNTFFPRTPQPKPSAARPDDRAPLDALRRLAVEMAGRKLPGERELSQRLELSRQRLRTLLDILETEGVVERRQGSGTYAVDPYGADVSHVGLLIDARLKLGGDPFVSQLIERLQLCLQTAGIHCVVERTDGEGRPRFLGDGVVAVGLAGWAAVSRLRADDPPAVILMAMGSAQVSPRLAARLSVLVADDEEAGTIAARRLLEEGCRRLVFFGRADLPASHARWDGVQGAVTAAGEGVTAEMVECPMNYGAGRALGLELAGRFGTSADAVSDVGLISANDWLAVGLRSGLAAAGSPLRDRPLTSFDGLPIAADPTLKIRSLAFPFDLVAEDSLAELRRLAHHRGGRSGRIIRYGLEWADSGTI
jgi:DNA-binding LacI/PurR family transcriptional regulator